MNITGLKANQIFLAYCVAIAVSLNLMLLFFADKVLEIRKKWWWALAILLTISLNMWALLGFQYGPQIFGMHCMFGVIFGMICMWKENRVSWFLFVALMLSAGVAVYSEFVYYLFVIFVIITAVNFLYYRKKMNVASMIYKTCGAGCLGLVLCIPATYKVIRYYFYLLDSANDGIDSLNADGWIVVSYREILSNLLGFSFSPDKSVDISFGVWGIIGTIVVWGLIVVGGIHAVCTTKKCEWISILAVCGVFAVMETAFALMGFDYGEFKHLISIQPFVCAVLVKCLMEIEVIGEQWGKAQQGWLVGYTVILVVVLANVIQILCCFPNYAYNVYTTELNELSELAEEFDDDLVILIPEEYICDVQHQIIYSLKNNKLVIPGNSYYYKYTNHDKLEANAVIIDKQQEKIDEMWSFGKVLYETERFCVYELDYENQYFENGTLKYNIADEKYEISEDCIRMDDGIYCATQTSGFKLWGPYVPILKGNYAMTCNLQILANTTGKSCVGYIELYDTSHDKSLSKINIYEESSKIELAQFELEQNCEYFETRIWLQEGVEAEINDITITKK
jgi:hypothetical protein